MDRTDLDSSAVLVASHAVDLVHDQDVFAAHGLRCTYRDDGNVKMKCCSLKVHRGSGVPWSRCLSVDFILLHCESLAN